jgi:catecholate siderophore receptor
MKKTPVNVKLPRSFRHEMALSLSTAAMLLPVAAVAQSQPEKATAEAELPSVKVRNTAIDPNPNAQTGVPYKAKTSADTRHTRPLAETPQTIQVLTKTAIDDSGMTDLKAILSAQPGITLGTGENGNSFGDRYIIRGQEARSDVFVDGLRDPGMSTRESFAVEQLEVSKGPNSSFAGRGTAGGAINAITKQATLDYDFTRLSGGVGTDGYYRVTADVNKGFSDQMALRANVLTAKEDVPGRSPSSRARDGLALSALYEINPDLSATIDYYGLRAKDTQPDLGSYLVGTLPNRKPASDVRVYAQSNDFLRSDVDTVTARVKYKIAPDVSLNSLTRYGATANSYATTGASASRTYYNGTTALPAGTAAIDSGHTGWQDVSYFAHQSNVRLDKTVLGLKNEFIVGVEFTDHKVRSGNYGVTNANAANCSTTSGGTNNAYCFTDGDLSQLAGRSYTQLGKTQDWHVRTLALSAMDTVDLTDRLTAFGGLRADRYSLTLDRFSNTGSTAGQQTASYKSDDTLINGHLGLSYKLTPQGMVYASAASAEDINGGEPDSGTNAGYGGLIIDPTGTASSKPERSVNLELGTKWNLLDDKLLATAAAFQSTKSDVMESLSTTGYASEGSYNSGGNRVRGVEFSLTGNVTDQLTVQAGAAFMKSKVTKSYTASNVGKPLANFANQTFSLMGKYQFTPKFSLGATARHESGRCGGQPDTAVSVDATTGMCAQPVPSFTVYDLVGSYRFNKRVDMRVNVLNVTDKDYYTAVYRSGAFLYKGDSRAARVTFNYEM